MNCDFYKYHALGNDYLVMDPNKVKLNLTTENIQRLCQRNFGIGSDGILYGPFWQDDVLSFKIFNPDGSEAEKSGNGIRIFSRYLFDAGYLANKQQFYLNTVGGQVAVEILDDKAEQIKVDMGKVTFNSSEIPMTGANREAINEEMIINDEIITVHCLSIGNPHCVIPCKNISKERVEQLGPMIENHQLFPNRINVQLLKVMDRHNIQIEIWERGAGYTLASGSSSCAAASVAYKLGLVNENIRVHMPGGIIEIDIATTGHVYMTGSVTAVMRGYIADDLTKDRQ